MSIQFINEDCIKFMQSLKNESIDTILTDPPYLNSNNEWDKDFDFDIWIKEAFRILKNDGVLAIFGQNITYWQRNIKILEAGFYFKKEIIWDKVKIGIGNCQSHENISIFSKSNNRKLYPLKVDYIDYIKYQNFSQLYKDINIIYNSLGNNQKLKELKDYIENDIINYRKKKNTYYKSDQFKKTPIYIQSLQKIKRGVYIQSVIKIHMGGMSSIYKIHRAQKPIKLIEYLLEIIQPKGVVLDTFAGSGVVGIACNIKNYDCILVERDEKIFVKMKDYVENYDTYVSKDKKICEKIANDNEKQIKINF